jgi:hypothetical protein
MATIQDGDVRHIEAELSTLLILARTLAGRRGWSNVTFHGQGFTYTLFAVRDPRANPGDTFIDDDRSGEGLAAEDNAELRARLAQLLEIEP